MSRILCLALAALASTAAFAQNYSGTYATSNAQGGTVTLKLKQDAKQQVTGTLGGNGTSFDVKAQSTADGLMGTVSGSAGNLYLMGQFQGEQLIIVLAEPGPGGQPNLQTARRIAFTKGAASAASAKKQSPSAGGADSQLAQFLTRNPWCGFTYNQHTGTSTSERVVFYGNGTVVQTSGRETYNSGPNGTVAGQHGGGQQGRWKVANGVLHLSQDGVNWSPQPLQVTQNSNGYPIIKSDGKEYMVCR
jgi:hypothetical protein